MKTTSKRALQERESIRTRRRRAARDRSRYLRQRYEGLTVEQVDLVTALQGGLCSTPHCPTETELVVDLDQAAQTYVMTCRACMTRRVRPHLSRGAQPRRVPRVRAEPPSEL